MEPDQGLSELARRLHGLGVRTADGAGAPGLTGFPVVVPTAAGNLVLDLPSPALLDGLDPSLVGLAVVDPMGNCRVAWGAAGQVPDLRGAQEVKSDAFRELVRETMLGRSACRTVGGHRCHGALLDAGPEPEILVLVTDASAERALLNRAELHERTTNVLRVMGGAMAVEGDLLSLCASVVHALGVSADLAAVMLWTTEEDGRVLRLRASRGLTPVGQERMGRLRVRGGDACAAELAANTRRVQFHHRVAADARSAAWEAKYCLLAPGGAIALPLTGGDELYGVLEAVGRERDARFAEYRSLFETVAEHLSVAVRAAILLETTLRLATHDPLTGIANHRALHEFLGRRLAEAIRENRPLGVVMVDVDHFREFNESEGHATGDAVLKAVAGTLRESVRISDLAARYGGEEFTLVMPGQGLADVRLAADRVRSRIESLDLAELAGASRSLTVSLGCAAYPETASEVPALLRAADEALYAAKRLGRNRTVAYEGPYQAPVKVRPRESNRPRAA
ncbi:MAG: sensor domain-containing diguanylate cyclase [Fimbriimonadaceae bacterium]|nr:sensor domain-containing diguanylate cyclase [Fimbriimonadaceae bacterium]